MKRGDRSLRPAQLWRRSSDFNGLGAKNCQESQFCLRRFLPSSRITQGVIASRESGVAMQEIVGRLRLSSPGSPRPRGSKPEGPRDDGFFRSGYQHVSERIPACRYSPKNRMVAPISGKGKELSQPRREVKRSWRAVRDLSESGAVSSPSSGRGSPALSPVAIRNTPPPTYRPRRGAPHRPSRSARRRSPPWRRRSFDRRSA